MNDLATQCSPILDSSVQLALRVSGEEQAPLELAGEKTTVGSGQSCTLRLTQEGVRPLHCLITRGDQGLTIRRWADGTLLNGELFTEAPLQLGDRLTLGPVELELIDLSEFAPTGEDAEPTSETADHEAGHHNESDEATDIPWDVEGEATADAQQTEQDSKTDEESQAESLVRANIAAHGRGRARRLIEQLRWAREEKAKIAAEVVDLKAQLEIIATQRDEFADQRLQLAESLEQAEGKLAAAQQEVEQLRSEHDSAVAEIQEQTNSRIAELTAQIADRDALVTDLQVELARRQDEYAALTEVAEAAALSEQLRRESEPAEISTEPATEAANAGASQSEVEQGETPAEAQSRLGFDLDATDDEATPETDAPTEEASDQAKDAASEPEPAWDTEEVVEDSWKAENPFDKFAAKPEAEQAEEALNDAFDVEAKSEFGDKAEEKAEGEGEGDDYVDWSTTTSQSPVDEAEAEATADDNQDENLNDDLWGTAKPAGDTASEAWGIDSAKPNTEPAWGGSSTEATAPEPSQSEFDNAANATAEPETTSSTESRDHEWASASGGDAWDIETTPPADDAFVVGGSLKSAGSDESEDLWGETSSTATEAEATTDVDEFEKTNAFGEANAFETRPEAEPASELPVAEELVTEESATGESVTDELGRDDDAEPSESDSFAEDEFAAASADQPRVDVAEQTDLTPEVSEAALTSTATKDEDLWGAAEASASDESADAEEFASADSSIADKIADRVAELAEAPSTFGSTTTDEAGETDAEDSASAISATATTLFDKPAEEQAETEKDEAEPAGSVSFIEQYKHLLDEDTQREQEAEMAAPTPAPTPVAEPVETEESNEDECKLYMEQMMARLRGESPSDSSAAPATVETTEVAPEPSSETPSEPAPPEQPKAPITSLDELRSGPKPEQTADISALRDLANNSAREAIKIANTKQARETALANLAFSAVAGGIGGFMAWDADGTIGLQLIGGAAAVAGAGYWACRTVSSLKGPKQPKKKATEASSEIGLPISGVVEK